ncbi:hypothetical protein [Streptomyces sp. NPDC091294]|uniref:hypothetical protein n=1 Tax=Streptomyces sp. NPDC091294 TaxID=3365992 RepID=UPI00382C872F
MIGSILGTLTVLGMAVTGRRISAIQPLVAAPAPANWLLTALLAGPYPTWRAARV